MTVDQMIAVVEHYTPRPIGEVIADLVTVEQQLDDAMSKFNEASKLKTEAELECQALEAKRLNLTREFRAAARKRT